PGSTRAVPRVRARPAAASRTPSGPGSRTGPDLVAHGTSPRPRAIVGRAARAPAPPVVNRSRPFATVRPDARSTAFAVARSLAVRPCVQHSLSGGPTGPRSPAGPRVLRVPSASPRSPRLLEDLDDALLDQRLPRLGRARPAAVGRTPSGP